MNNLQHNEITAATERIKLRLRRTAEDIVAIGKDLIVIKEQLQHGEFLPWIEREFEMGEQSARNFMNVASRFGANPQLLGISPSALYELAAPSTPPEVVQQITAKARDGESVSVAEVKDLKKQLKQAQQEKQQTLKLLDDAENTLEKERYQAQEKLEQITERYQEEVNQSQAQINRLKSDFSKATHRLQELENAPPQIKEIEKIVEVEKVPDGFSSIAEATQAMAAEKRELEAQLKAINQEIEQSHNKRYDAEMGLRNAQAKMDNQKAAVSAAEQITRRFTRVLSDCYKDNLTVDAKRHQLPDGTLQALRQTQQEVWQLFEMLTAIQTDNKILYVTAS